MIRLHVTWTGFHASPQHWISAHARGFNLIAIYPFSDTSSLLLAIAIDQVWPGFLVW